MSERAASSVQQSAVAQLASDKALIVVAGPTLIGKTTLALQVGNELGIACIDVDDVRQEMYPSELSLRPRAEIANRREGVYREAYRRARVLLDSGSSVIVIGTHTTAQTHVIAKEAASQAGVPLVVVQMDTAVIPDLQEFLRERLVSRETKNDSKSMLRGEGALGAAIDCYREHVLIREADVTELITVNPTAPQSDQRLQVVSKLSAHLKRQ